ncbi:MAG TPA: DUF3795 domain-containing protein [Methanotrichaceae archaeon]|nr:DUF3795 domain-containing protein [Methanotrichaceae archaeon]
MTSKRSANRNAIPTKLIAPCGMNCRLCLAYTRDKKPCPGCRGDDSPKPESRVGCRIKNCEKMVNAKVKYCFGCNSFPCARLRNLDKRYRTKYGMSMIDNLEKIRKLGIRQFIRSEKERWRCPKCGEMLCVHTSQCPFCQDTWR